MQLAGQQQINQLGNQLTQIADSLRETSDIAKSNARAIQAWEFLIERNRDEAEEDRSILRVELNELRQASRENIAQHFDFRERFDQVLGEIRDLRQRMAG